MMRLLDSALFAAVLDAAVRGTFILLAALAATSLMRRRSASARHLVWLAALAALLLLPLARGFVPEWRVLPAIAPPLVSPAPAPGGPAAPLAGVDAQPAAIAASPAPSPAPASSPTPFRLPADWKTLALLAWAAGAALFGLRLAFGVARVRWIERRATELTDDEWVRLTDGLSRRLGLGRIVRLLREPAASVPMTWGIFRPIILLPGEADGWEGERRRVVLAHELAHVRRWDALTQWIAHLALAVYWFNPLVWMAARKLREEREHACDDAVLEIGTAPTDYADHLLTIVRSLGSAPGPAAALAMARRSQFEGRLLAILDHAVRRNGVSRAAALATTAAALACLLPLAALRPAQPAEAQAAVQHAPVESTSSPAGKLVDRVAGTVRSVVGIGEEKAGAPVDAAGAAGQTASGLLPKEVGTGTPAPAGTPAPTVSGEPAQLLRAMENRQDPGLYAEIIRAAEDIRSSSDRRVVLSTLLAKRDLSHDNVVAIIAATRTMGSDTDKRVVLESAVRHGSFRANPMPHAFYETMRTFSSATDQRVVLTTLLSARRLDTVCLELIFQHLPRLGSDTDERVVLLHAVQTQRIEGSARQAYLAAARAMDSDTERSLALSRLMDAGEAGSGSASAPAPGRLPGSSSDRVSRDTEGGPRVWTSENHWTGTRDGAPLEIRIQAAGVLIDDDRWEITGIQPGGSLLVEERVGATTRRVRAVRGADGRPAWTYTVDGRTRPFDDAAHRWMRSVIRDNLGI
ncbi:MAG TPA: M56 family metallopeptidase [Longimicrobium sp.]|nr:M56 family metallopeptidase [Longimicrobium sp.]